MILSKFCLKQLRATVTLLLFIGSSNSSCTEIEKKDTVADDITTISSVFQRLNAEETGLHFSNTIKENLETIDNLFDFDYFYNGAGVGVEDFNNDGLLDIFFCGNQVPNKLFLNKGNLKFEDISEKAKVNMGKHWSNGVTFVDINNDGYMDIYVSQGGPKKTDDRKNLLLINNGDLTFEERALHYNLHDSGISTQSAFFDFDNDGDLDCVVVNENELYGVDPINLYKLLGGNPEKKSSNSSHFYRNDNGRFTDITKSAGLERPFFGLGLCVSDINNDGWLDMYIASDYYIPDALFINNRNGSFDDRIKEYTQHISFYGMGVDIADINNDGLQDIFVLDMSSNDHVRAKTLMASMSTEQFDYLTNEANFQYQYMYNSLQLNIGDNKFNDIAQLTQTANTDWSWSVLMSDFDNDADSDIYVTNGYRKYALDNDLRTKVMEAKNKYGQRVPLAVKKQIYNEIPSEKLTNVLFQNETGLKFQENTQKWGLNDLSFSNGATQADLDNDGDLDLVVNNMDEEAFLYQNTTSDNGLGNYLKVKTQGYSSEDFSKVTITHNGKSQILESKRVRGYMSAQDKTMHFGLGKSKVVDTVSIEWLNGDYQKLYDVVVNSEITFKQEQASKRKTIADVSTSHYFKTWDPIKLGIDFQHHENLNDDFKEEILLPYKQSTLGPFLAKSDINGDGLLDIYVGGASGQAGQLFLQTTTGFKKLKNKAFEDDKLYEDMESLFFDFDQDGDQDLYIVSGGYEFSENSSLYADRIYINDGKGVFTRFQTDVLSSFSKSGKAVTAIDFDLDGDSDILVGNRVIPGKYPHHSGSILYENTGGNLRDITQQIAPDLVDFGIVNSIVVTDIDNDGWQDFIAVGEWTGIGIFKNTNGVFSKANITESISEDKGWWFSINETDINNDGLKDYVIGNIGLNFKLNASAEKPLKIFSNDFDEDGINDIVLSKKYNNTYVPVRGRECSSQQMPFIKEKFKSYSSFANAGLEDIYGTKNLENSFKKEANTFESILLLNQGNFNFKKVTLPVLAQQYPILAVEFLDIDKDGYEDCIIAGNIYDTEVETPRLDAISGIILKSNGKDGYSALPNHQTGLYITGDVKHILKIGRGKETFLLSTSNNNRLNAYKLVLN